MSGRLLMESEEDLPDKATWLRTIVDRYESPLLRYAVTITGDIERARDAVQETFLKLICQGQMGDPSQVAGWLYAVCRSRAVDAFRRQARLRALSPEESANMDPQQLFADHPGGGTSQSPQEAAAVADEQQAHLAEQIDTLPAQQQEVLKLRFYDGLQYREISQATGLSVGHVGYLLHTALKQLRSRLTANSPCDRKTSRDSGSSGDTTSSSTTSSSSSRGQNA